MRDPGDSTRLTVYLAVAYALLIVYACLHPLTGWRVSGLPLFDYLTAPFPKYYRTEDLVLNVLGYLPLGFVLAPALPRRLGHAGTIALATLLAGLLSLTIETLQNFLPTRISTNVDLGCNIAGALIGAVLGTLWGRRLFDQHGWLNRWRTARIIPGRTGDFGLILLALWLLTQLMPESMVFGSGDLRRMLSLPNPLPFDPAHFIQLEAALVATAIVSVGLLASSMMRHASPWPIALLLLLAIGAKSLASLSFFVPPDPLGWLTPGARIGLAIGLPLLALSLLLPSVLQHALAGMVLLAATVLANLIPDNPYLAVEQRLLDRGNFLNFHGLTHIVASGWPFVALAYLSAIGLWRGEHLHAR